MPDIIVNRFPTNLANKIIDFEADSIKIALLKAAYTPDKDHDVWSDVSTHEVAGTGYTTGGAVLANCSVTQDDANDLAKLDADDPVWEGATLTGDNAPQYAVIYDDTLGTKDIICIFDFGEAIACNGGDFTVQFNASGIMKMEQGA